MLVNAVSLHHLSEARWWAKVARFGSELVPLVTSGPPGVTGFAGGRPKATEIIGYWPALLGKDRVAPTVTVYEA